MPVLEHVLDIITLLLFLSALFTFINVRLLKLPSTIGIMITSLGVSLIIKLLGFFIPNLAEGATQLIEELDFTSVLLNLMLSFLLFAGALHMNIKLLIEEKWPILTLATIGVLFSTFLIGTSVYYVIMLFGIQVQYIYCLLFGALISPTDPIALNVQLAGTTTFADSFPVNEENE